jgi:hypothetical protein
MGVQWDSISAIRRLQDTLWFSEEVSIVQYFDRVLGTHETSYADMCLNETYSKVGIYKNLSDSFPIQNGLKEGHALSPLLFNFL